ncbi:MAG: MFS transporter, partial [Chloroflexota bacterium]|nr:MFS transporter [Chloroflexota bacterium]
MRKHPNTPRVVWTLTLCTALSLVGDATLYAVLPSQYAAAGVTAVQVGWLLSINRLVRLPLNVLSGRLSRRMGPRLPYIAGLATGTLSTLGYSLSRGFWPLLFWRALWGVAWALLVVAAYAMVLDVSTEERRGRFTGIYASFSYFGGALGALLGGFLVDAWGFPRAMFALGALTSLGCLGALTLPRTRHNEENGKQVSAALLLTRITRWRHTLGAVDSRFWLIWGLNFAHRFFFAGVFYSTLGYYLSQSLEQNVRVAGTIVGIASLTAILLFVRNLITILAGPGLGYLSDYLGDRTRVLLLGEVLGVIGLGCFALRGNLWLIGVGVFMAAIAYGVVPPMLVSWMGDMTPRGERSGVVSGYQTMGDLGSGLGPLFAYPLMTLFGRRPVYAVSAILLALTIP